MFSLSGTQVRSVLDDMEGELSKIRELDPELHFRLSLAKGRLANRRVVRTIREIAQAGRGVRFLFDHGSVGPTTVADHLNGQVGKCNSPLVSLNGLDEKPKYADVALVQGFFGQDASHVEACSLSVKLLSLSNPRPREWIFVEAQRNEADARFKWVVQHGARYIFVRILNDRQDYFVKEQLWNIGAKNAKSDRLVFVDADVAYCQTDWLAAVERTFIADGCQLFQPHAWSWRANDDIVDKNANDLNLLESFAYKRSNDTPLGIFGGHTGYDIAIIRSLYDKIGGFTSLKGAGGDFLMWSTLCKRDGNMSNFIKGNPNRELILKLRPEPIGVDIGCSNLVCLHNAHGDYASRRKSYVLGPNAQCFTNNYGQDYIEEMPS